MWSASGSLDHPITAVSGKIAIAAAIYDSSIIPDEAPIPAAPWLFPSCRALPSPRQPQSSTFQVSLARVFPSCFQSSSLPLPGISILNTFLSAQYSLQVSLACVCPSCCRLSSLPCPWCVSSQHFPQHVFFVCPHHMPVPVQSFLRYIWKPASLTLFLGYVRSCVHGPVFACLCVSHIHLSILISFISIFFLLALCGPRCWPGHWFVDLLLQFRWHPSVA